MGDARHKNSAPADLVEEPVTDEFIRAVRDALKANRALNAVESVAEGQAGYRIDSHAALARALSRHVGSTVSEKQINNIIGPVRTGSKWDRVADSKYVRPISWLLKLSLTTAIRVREQHASFFAFLAQLDDPELEKLAAAVAKAYGKVFK